jgi:hypothetical protein
MVVATALPNATSVKVVPWIRSSNRRNTAIREVDCEVVMCVYQARPKRGILNSNTPRQQYASNTEKKMALVTGLNTNGRRRERSRRSRREPGFV